MPDQYYVVLVRALFQNIAVVIADGVYRLGDAPGDGGHDLGPVIQVVSNFGGREGGQLSICHHRPGSHQT